MPRRLPVARSMDGIRPAGCNPLPAVLENRPRRRFVRISVTALMVVVVLVGVFMLLVPQPVALATSLTPLWQPGTYLVLFENDAELRPTGGFIGSYAVVHVHSNRTFDYTINTNIYKTDNAYTADHSIAPPEAMKGITSSWALRDSNWDIDFADASKTISWFYTQETGESVDGIVAVTGQAAKQLLAKTGPVELADGTKLAGDANFYDTLAYKIEKEYFFSEDNRTTNEPKQLLAGIIPQLKSRLWSPLNDVFVAQWLDSMLATKQIIMHFNDDRQLIVEAKGWADRIDDSTQQYLALNNANLGGMKSSQHMTQSVQLTITTFDSTHAQYKLSVSRAHNGTGIWPDHRNDNLTRIVLPNGAVLQSADLDGIAVVPATQEQVNGRTSVGFRIDTEPGTTRELSATFLVPIDTKLSPTFMWQKQPGVTSDDVVIAKDGTTLLHGEIDTDSRVDLR